MNRIFSRKGALFPCSTLLAFSLVLSLEVCSRDNALLDSLAHALEVQEEPQARVHTLMALAEGWASADTAKAGNYLRQARDLVASVDPAPARSAAWRKLGAIASNQGSYRQALHAFLKAQALDRDHGDDSLVIANLLSAGNVEMKLDHYDKALDHYLDALRLADRKPFRKSQSMALCNIGLVHANQSRFDEAIRYYRDALAIQESLNDPKATAITLGNLGIFHAVQAEFDAAIDFLGRALAINREREDQPSIANNLNNLGNLYRDKGDFEQAIAHLQQSLDLHRELGNQRMTAYNLVNMASIYCKQGAFGPAIDYAQQSLQLSQQLNLKDARKEVYRTLTDAYAAQQQYDSAHAYLERYVTVKDSLFNEESSRQMAEMQTKYEAEKKEERIASLQKQEELKDAQLQTQEAEVRLQTFLRNTFIAGFFLVVLIGFFWVRGYRKKLAVQEELVSKREEARQKEIDQKVAEMRLTALRAQMNPHFVFNALNAIQNFIMKSDKEAGYLYLSKFARLIRMILENSPKGTVSLEEEVKMLTLYLEMESLRFDSRFVYELEVDPSLSQSVEEIPSMIIQPYVENAIVHGLLNKMDGEKGRLEISIARADQGIRCTITDNGVGRKKAEELKRKKLLTHRSVGISNTRERLEILNLERPDKTEVKTQDLVDAHNEVIGTSVELVIPLAK